MIFLHSFEKYIFSVNHVPRYFGHLMQNVDSVENTLMLGGIRGQEEKGRTEDEMAGWHHRLDGKELG